MAETFTTGELDSSDSPSESLMDAAPSFPEHSWLVSICFWSTLLTATAIYAAVALSPKFCVWNRVRLQHHENAARLAELEAEVAYLERVEAALETDPEFRNRASGVRTGEEAELIPVRSDLVFGSQQAPVRTTHSLTTVPTYHRFAQRLASDQKLRTLLICLTAFLTFFAFAILNDGGIDFVVSAKGIVIRTLTWPLRRYRTSEQPNVNECEEVPEAPQSTDQGTLIGAEK